MSKRYLEEGELSERLGTQTTLTSLEQIVRESLTLNLEENLMKDCINIL